MNPYQYERWESYIVKFAEEHESLSTYDVYLTCMSKSVWEANKRFYDEINAVLKKKEEHKKA